MKPKFQQKPNFQQKLILSFVLIFALFTTGIVIFEQKRARRYKTEALQERLDAYADEISRYVSVYGGRVALDSLLPLMPPELRVTLVGRGGEVVYDNLFADPARLENHLDRPEIADAMAYGRGIFIRTSATNDKPYLYYAKDNGGAPIVRVALPYDIGVRSFLKPDNAFLYFVIALFLAGFLFIYYVSRYFGRSVRSLRDFSVALKGGAHGIDTPRFPDDEFGEIGAQLVRDMDRIRRSEKELAQEREKLLLHVQTSAEGVCFFHPDRSVAFYNGLFLQYFNVLCGGSAISGILDDANLKPVADFLDDSGGDNYYETRIREHNREFMLRLNIFEDGSFEIILTDITAKEAERRLKQEITGNIAHELRTPITSIRGFLEIVLDNDPGAARSREYLERAYAQIKTLSDLIADMTLLTRINENRDPFEFSRIDLARLLERVRLDTSASLEQRNIAFTADIPEGLVVTGNENLLYSVFRNLTDNVITHAGTGVDIRIRANVQDGGNVRVSFADTGAGISDERHLGRLFERFYRVNEGRTRDTGGSGLGLSIVRNAVRLHGSDITVRNTRPHGLEFIFSLKPA